VAEKKKRRVVKKAPETIREQRAKAADTPPKKRRVHQAVGKAKQPVGKVGKAIAKLFRPLGFLLWPFKTKPARFVGRILSKVLLLSYFKSAWAEVRQVAWPGRKKTFQLTLAVFIFATAITLYVTVLDSLLDRAFKQLLT
jgi:preprotein translocase SecE subunit